MFIRIRQLSFTNSSEFSRKLNFSILMKSRCTKENKMSSTFTFLTLCLLITAAYCNHDQQNHHKDDKWISFVSQIESFWKTDASVLTSETSTETPLKGKGDVYIFEKVSEEEDYKSRTDNPFIKQYTTSFDGEDIKNAAKMSLGLIISIPIVGVIVLICCCYCICKCCCGMCASNDRVVVMNSNVINPVPPASTQPTQIIVQQPIYQHAPPAFQEIHHYPPNQQWGPQQFQQQMPPQFQQTMPPPQYYPNDGVENPNFYHASAPPQMTPDKY